MRTPEPLTQQEREFETRLREFLTTASTPEKMAFTALMFCVANDQTEGKRFFSEWYSGEDTAEAEKILQDMKKAPQPPKGYIAGVEKAQAFFTDLNEAGGAANDSF